MRKLISKLTAFVTALALALTMAGLQTVTAKAAVTANEATGGTLTVGTTEEAADISIYRIVEVKVTDDGALVYNWNEAVESWVNNEYSKYANPEDFNADLEEEVIKSFYTRLAAAIDNGDVNISPAATESSVTGSHSFTGLNAGNYLVVVKGSTYLYTASAGTVMPTQDADDKYTTTAGSADVEVKNQKISVEKEVTGENGQDQLTNGVSVGDTVSWAVYYDIPDYGDNTINKEYYVYDYLPADGSLALNDGSIKIYGYTAANGGDREEVKEELNSPVYTAIALNNSEILGKLQLDENAFAQGGFLYSFSYSAISKYEQILVEYDTTVTDQATVKSEGKNTAGIRYSKPTGDSYGESETKVDVPDPYGTVITKVDKNDSNKKLTGAIFEVYEADGADPIKFVKMSDGYYRKAAAGEESPVTKLEVGSEGEMLGILKFDGVAAGTYVLKETKAPDDYNLPADTITLTIRADVDNGYTVLTVSNTASFTLPSTGGMGTVIFTVIGILLMAAGYLLFLGRKKKA